MPDAKVLDLFARFERMDPATKLLVAAGLVEKDIGLAILAAQRAIDELKLQELLKAGNS